MTDAPHRSRAFGAAFAQGGDRYERLRPGYPAAAVDWLIADLEPGVQVADIGAGTGKLTAALIERGMAVTAIDPSTDMLRQLQQRLPDVVVGTGSAEATGLADGSVGLATFAQSWHWVDPAAGTAELRRIVAAAGRVGWVWNFLDERTDWVAGLVAIWHSIAGTESDVIHQPPSWPDISPSELRFGPIEDNVVDWTLPMSVADLSDLVTTRSYYLAADDGRRREVHQRSARFLNDRFGAAARVDLPYRTRCYRSTRLA